MTVIANVGYDYQNNGVSFADCSTWSLYIS
jgi:hypothetical protein